ncbi:ROK family glucokinase [Branchiibius cervicis]|uniref:Glucokinase n=1 Tax=Branchiibius cervicis TaxID=908252 RepID=A0ABW2AR27_9MICO
MAWSIGIDIGGTKIAGGLVDESGRIVQHERVATPATDPHNIVVAVGGLIQRLAEQSPQPLTGAGVASAGYIDKIGSTVLFAPNLAWRDEPLKARLAAYTDLPVLIENDANAAAFGEFRHGAGRDIDDMIMVTVGTGVGGGIVIGGRLLRGAFGLAGEIGHMRVVPGGTRCGCGNRGCLEAYGSGTALVREAREMVISGSAYAARLAELCHDDPSTLIGAQVTQAAQEGDPASQELLSELGRWIGEACASLAALFDPELFVIGGGVADAGDLLLEPIHAGFAAQLTGRGYRPEAKFVKAELGNDAGVIGAAALAAELPAPDGTPEAARG